MLESSCKKPVEDGTQLLRTLRTKQDDIAQEIANDLLLIRVGEILIAKLGARRRNDVSQRLRQLSRLKIILNENRKSLAKCSLTYYQIIDGRHFDNIIQSVRELVGTSASSEGITVFEKLGLALRLGHNLIKLGQIKTGMAMRKMDEKGEKASDVFF